MGLLVLQLAVFSLAVWLGLYLMGRNPASIRLRFTGLGLISYGAALGLEILRSYTPDQGIIQTLILWQGPFLFLPALFWTRTLIDLLPEDVPFRTQWPRWWAAILIPLAIIFYILATGVDFRLEATPGNWFYYLFVAIVLLPLLAAFGGVIGHYRRAPQSKPLGLLLTITIFFFLGASHLFFPALRLLPQTLVFLSVGGDLICLGLGIAVFDAFDEGEALLPDLIRALDFSVLSVALFAGPVALVILFGTGLTFPMIALLLVMITVALIRQIFADQIDTLLDHVAFISFPQVRQARAELRTAASALPRVNQSLDLLRLGEEEFARLTRRALSHYGDFSRLASSPLTCLPQVDLRLAERNAADDTLERAAELKALLTASIERLKPRNKGDFGTSDEWRYYNALYFPYVIGLKPYSRRADQDNLDPSARQALDWFRSTVPERTLYNWQTAAARLVAQDLREQILGLFPDDRRLTNDERERVR